MAQFPFVTLAVLLASVCAGAERRQARPRLTTAPALSVIDSFSVVPAAVRLRSDDPDASPAPVSVTVTWRATKGDKDLSWALSLRAGAAAFGNCGRVPVSAVEIQCSVANATGGGGTGVCNPSFALSSSPRQLAGGNEGQGTKDYAVTLMLSFKDTWRYPGAVASSCSLDLVYTLDFP